MRREAVLTGLLLWASVVPLLCAEAPDEIERLRRDGKLPADISPRHAYSDFTDPVGRFMDSLGAGALSDAKRLRPDACASWGARPEQSARTGQFWVGATRIDMNTVCAGP